jgi:hypothetical protein
VNAIFVTTIQVNDPHFDHPVFLDVYKEDGGMLLAIESLFDTMGEKAISPYGNGPLDRTGKEVAQ